MSVLAALSGSPMLGFGPVLGAASALGTTPILGVTIPDGITFAACAVLVLAGAFGVVLSRNPVHSALFLIMTLFGVAVLFVEQEAQFLAVVQVIVYAGAIVVLFLFVIMLIGVDREERLAAEPLKGQRVTGALLGLMALAEVLLLARINWPVGAPAVAGSSLGAGSNVAKLGRSVFTTYLLPFEVTSILLVIAVIGAVVLARRPPAERRHALQSAPGPEPGAAARPADQAPALAAEEEPGVSRVGPDQGVPDPEPAPLTPTREDEP